MALPDYVKQAVQSEANNPPSGLPNYVRAAIRGERTPVEFKPEATSFDSQQISTITGRPVQEDNRKGINLDPALRTAENVGRIYPVLDAGASLVSSIYGIPAGGLVGLASLPFGLDKSRENIEKVTGSLVYEPQTERGRELAGSLVYPFEKLHQGAEFVGKGTLNATGSPGLATAAHTAIEAAPIIFSGMRNVPKKAASITKQMLRPEAENYSAAVREGMRRGIRFEVKGKKRSALTEKYMRGAEDAVGAIISEKQNLKYINDTGATTTGSLPKNLNEFTQAISQVKRRIYEKYNKMARTSGESGATFNTSGVIKELERASNDLKLNPQARAYAASMIDDIKELHNASPEIIEARIADLNKSLGGFYEGRIGKAKAQVDASIADLMRKELDQNIIDSISPGYQELKNKYGSLLKIEGDVNHRAIIAGRQNVKSLADFTNIFTGGEIVGGVMEMFSGSPSGVPKTMKGIAGWAIKNSIKRANNPDLIIKKMFSTAERSNEVASFKLSLPEGITSKASQRELKRIVTEVKRETNRNIPAYKRSGAKLDLSERSGLPASLFEDLLIMGKNPELKKTLIEKLSVDGKYRPLIDMIENIPTTKALPGPTRDFQLISPEEVAQRAAQKTLSGRLGGKNLPNRTTGSISKAEQRRINEIRRK